MEGFLLLGSNKLKAGCEDSFKDNQNVSRAFDSSSNRLKPYHSLGCQGLRRNAFMGFQPAAFSLATMTAKTAIKVRWYFTGYFLCNNQNYSLNYMTMYYISMTLFIFY